MAKKRLGSGVIPKGVKGIDVPISFLYHMVCILVFLFVDVFHVLMNRNLFFWGEAFFKQELD